MTRKFTTPVELPADPTAALQASTKQYADRLTSRVSVRSYGAVGNGSTDDATAIQNTIAACPAGGTVFFPPGIYAVGTPLVVPPQITLEASHGQTIQYTGAAATPTSILTLAGFTGAAVLRLLGKTDQSPTGSVDHIGTRIRNLTIDGTGGPAGVKGVQVAGNVRELLLERVTVREVTDTGFWFGAGATSGLMPASFRLVGCLADSCGNNGYTFSNTPDATLIDCNALGNTNVGFYVAGFMNGQIANCRAEWSGLQGFYFTSGYWGTGQGSGGCNVLACSTDRSGQDGIRIDATGGGTLQFTNCFNRRDGRNGGTGGGGYAGFSVLSAATMPVIVDNHQVYPGVDDGGSGTNSPQYGFLTANTAPVTLNSGYIWAATTALNVAATTIVDNSVGAATGLTSAPTRVAPLPTATKQYVDSAITGQTVDVQVFTTPGSVTWTKPAGAVSVHVVAIGGGGGGGAGARVASGTANSGGAGGGGGSYGSGVFAASVLSATETVTVGAGGTAGVAATSSSSFGGTGGTGGSSIFGGVSTGYKLISFGGSGGAGGWTSTAGGGAGGGGLLLGATGATSTAGTAGAAPTNSSTVGGGGGGSAGGLAATQAALAGGAGGLANQAQVGNQAGAATTGSAAGSAPTNVTTGLPLGGGGGSGGASRVGAASGSGGAGGLYGGGGGGGATSANGQTAGTGGVGGAGIVVVTSYF